MKNSFLIYWAYIKEVIFTIALYSLLILTIGPSGISDVFNSNSNILIAVALGCFAASFSAFVFLGKTIESDFGNYLEYKGASSTFVNAIWFHSILAFLTVVVLLINTFVRTIYVTHAAFFLFFYTSINVFSLLVNVRKFIKLKQKFNFELKRQSSEEGE